MNIKAAFAITALFISPATFAGVIIQPVAASTDMGTSVGSPNNVINQSGLSVGYTSGITEYDEDSVGRHDSLDNNAIWASLGPIPPVFPFGNFDLDLGGMPAQHDAVTA